MGCPYFYPYRAAKRHGHRDVSSYKKEKLILAGIFLGILPMLTIQFGLLLAFFLWKRQYTIVITSLITIFCIEGLSILALGLSKNIGYFMAISGIISSETKPVAFNYASLNLSLNAFFYRLLLPFCTITFVQATALLASGSLIMLTAVLTKTKHTISDPRFSLEFSLILVLLCIISPIVHITHYVYLLIPIVLFWNNLNIFENSKAPWILFIISFLLISVQYSFNSFTLFHKGILSVFYSGQLYGSLLLFVIGISSSATCFKIPLNL